MEYNNRSTEFDLIKSLAAAASQKEITDIMNAEGYRVVHAVVDDDISNAISKAIEPKLFIYGHISKELSSFRVLEEIKKIGIDLFMSELRFLSREHIRMVNMDIKNDCISSTEINIGTVKLPEALEYEKVFREALINKPVHIVLVHENSSVKTNLLDQKLGYDV
ncbi:hypothetical protein HZI73_26140 (plasmid) [Vallitalea pronyensis]|uniref:RadC-like JAB domain-containing protein n=1 Tax=Vallitalea pronyensis TaxID=1348613 RepID=A0A8J8MQB0_9FIRM|nr:JAB domain-containing protein [Vallitalea pronyensis]QUI25895.1 hypothetical protein HZI73_26140 [Vallitalea pronyensis]